MRHRVGTFGFVPSRQPAPSIEDDARGLVDPSIAARHLQIDRASPSPALAWAVEYHWSVRWDVPTTFVQRGVPHPAVHLPDTGGVGGTVGWVRHRVATALLVVMLAGIAVVSFSARIAVWWGRVGQGHSSALPAPVRQLLADRPHVHEADVHAVMWCAIAIVVGLMARTWRARGAAWLAVWAAGGAVELCQAAFTTRSAEWPDVFGNSVGIAVAIAVVSMASVVHHVSSLTVEHPQRV